jgi:hypothetical protein
MVGIRMESMEEDSERRESWRPGDERDWLFEKVGV